VNSTKKIVVARGDQVFEIRILGCIDKAFSSFGNSPRRLMYHIIAKECALTKEKFTSSPDELTECLRGILGDAGHRLILSLAIREIQESFEISVSENCTLSEAIGKARSKFLTC